MNKLADVQGQDRATDRLRRAVASGRVPHSYLFTGPTGAGKMECARALAAAVNCIDAPGVGCGGDCEACDKIAEDRHPDVRVLEPQGAARIIPIDVIRSEVIASLGLPPHQARARFFLVGEATALLGPAANALLKTLEEPPDRTHFVLCTVAPHKLLPTIRSRCQRVSFLSRSPEDIGGRHDDDNAIDPGALVDELERAARGQTSAIDAADAATADKDSVLPALDALAHRVHRRAVELARQGLVDDALGSARHAAWILETRRGVAEHNAHAHTAVLALLARMRGLDAQGFRR